MEKEFEIKTGGYNRWTVSAMECYYRGCVCRGCIYKSIMDTPCRMKTAVIELVKKFGRPPEIKYGAKATKEQLEDLYYKKGLKLVEIYNILGTNQYELKELLNKYGMKLRKKKGSRIKE